MLILPECGLIRSVKVHRSNAHAFVDWVEASTLFLGEASYTPQLLDMLIENEIYEEQDFAWEFIDQCTSIIEKRMARMGMGYPICIENDKIAAKSDWTDFPAYSFCLFSSLSILYPKWKSELLGGDYTTQGEIFEKLSQESIKIIFPGWVVNNTGWSKTNTVNIISIVGHIAEWLNEQIGETRRWTKETAKEAGLDLVSYRPFSDANPGVPVYLWQCASGNNWKTKRKTPDLDLWTRIISWTVNPSKGMTIPFALPDDEMVQEGAIVAGLLLDRHRLLEPGRNNADWISAALRDEIVDWLNPYIAQTPRFEDNVL